MRFIPALACLVASMASAHLPARSGTHPFGVRDPKDDRVVDTGGFASFTAPQRMGIPSKLLYSPDENHRVLKPANSILWHDAVPDWLDLWIRRDGGD